MFGRVYHIWDLTLLTSLVSITMSEQEIPSSVAQRIIIKFLTIEGVKPSDILRRLVEQFRNNTLKKTQVYAWHKQFLEGQEAVENEAHRSRPRTSKTEENIRIVGRILMDDRRMTVAEIASEVGISYGNAQAFITDDLGFRKVSARWVPRLFTEDHKQQRLKVCKRLLARYEAEGEAFLHRIVTCDETWVHHYTLESKQASMEWRKKGESASVKAKNRLSAGKVLATIYIF